MKALTVEVWEQPVTLRVRSTSGCCLVHLAFCSRDLSSFFDLVPLLLVRLGISAPHRLPPILVGNGPISQQIFTPSLGLGESSAVLFVPGKMLSTFSHDLQGGVELMLRKPVVVWKSIWNEVSVRVNQGQQDSKRTSTILRGVVARADSLHVCPSFYLDGSRAAKFVDQLAAFTLDPVQDIHAVVIAGSIHVRGPLHH
jgi:hypothetical protein